MIPFATTQDGDRELIELAFSKKKADERKEWLRQFKVNGHQRKQITKYSSLPFSLERISTITWTKFPTQISSTGS